MVGSLADCLEWGWNGKHEVTWGQFQNDVAFERGLAGRDRVVKIVFDITEYCIGFRFNCLFQLSDNLGVQSTSSFLRHRSRSMKKCRLAKPSPLHIEPHPSIHHH